MAEHYIRSPLPPHGEQPSEVHYFYNGNSQTDRHWCDLLRHAYTNNQLIAEPQPIALLDGAELLHYELLLRCRQDDRIHHAGAFINSILGDRELMELLDHWMFVQALKLCQQHPNDRYSVNVSAPLLADGGFPKWAIDSANGAGIAPHRITLEITEQIRAVNPRGAIGVLNQLRSDGFRISLDDYGVGESSLYYACLFPIDEIKIAGAIVQRLPVCSVARAAVRSAFLFAQECGLSVVCEGVEDLKVIEVLRSIVCPFEVRVGLQGWAIG